MHGEPFSAFIAPMRQTARFCGMRWHAPFVVHGAHRIPEHELRDRGERYRALLVSLLNEAEAAHA